MEPSQRSTSAVFLLAMIDAARRLRPDVDLAAHATPALSRMLASPPLPTSQIPGHLLNDLYRALAATGGREVVREVSLAAMREAIGPLLQRLFDSTIRLYGHEPDALFAQVASIAAPMTRGSTLTWHPDGPRAGWVVIRPVDEPDPLAYAVWEGALIYFFDVAGRDGQVDEATLEDDGRSGRIRVAW